MHRIHVLDKNHGFLLGMQTLGSGYFGAAYLSGQSVIVQIIQYTILLPFGVAVAATIRVGNFLGKNAPDEARRAAISSLMLSFIAGVCGTARFCSPYACVYTLLRYPMVCSGGNPPFFHPKLGFPMELCKFQGSGFV